MVCEIYSVSNSHQNSHRTIHLAINPIIHHALRFWKAQFCTTKHPTHSEDWSIYAAITDNDSMLPFQSFQSIESPVSGHTMLCALVDHKSRPLSWTTRFHWYRQRGAAIAPETNAPTTIPAAGPSLSSLLKGSSQTTNGKQKPHLCMIYYSAPPRRGSSMSTYRTG